MKGKLIQKIVGVALGLTMAIGVGVAVGSKSKDAESVSAGAETLTLSNTDFSGKWTTTRGSQSGTVSGFTLESTDGLYDSAHLRHYAGATLTLSSSVGNMTSVIFTCTANGTSNYGPGKMSGSGYTASSGKTGTWTGNAASFSLTGGQSRITSIAITYTASSTTEATGISFSPSSLTVSGGDYGSFTPTLTGGSGGYEKTISWTSNNPSIIPAPANSEDGEAVNFTAANPASNTTVKLTGTVVSPGKASAAITITVNHVEEYTITYDPNGGTGTMSNSINKVSANGFTAPSGKEFKEWNTQADGKGATFNPNDTVSEDTDLYAIWQKLRYTTGFESSEGFTAGQNYQSTVTDGPTGKQWTTYYGVAATSNTPITGYQSMQMRYYNTSTALCYTQMAFDIDEAHSISFKAKSNGTNATVKVYYSTNKGSSWTLIGSSESLSTTASNVEMEISSYVESARFKIEFNADKPSSGNKYCLIDDVVVETQSAEPTVTSVSLSPNDDVTLKVGNSETYEVTISGSNLLGTETVDVVLTDDLGDYVSIDNDSGLKNGDTFTVTATTAEGIGELYISYNGGAVDSAHITVITEEAKTLSTISVHASGTTSYFTGDVFSKTDFEIYANYTDETSEDVTSSSIFELIRESTPVAISTPLLKTDTTVRVSYTESGTTKTTDITISVVDDTVKSLSWTKRPKFNSSATGFQTIWAGETTLGDLMSQNGSDGIGVFAPTWESSKPDSPTMGTGAHNVHIGLYDTGAPAPSEETTPLTSSYVFTAADNGKYVVAFYEGTASKSNTQLTVTKWRSVIDSSDASGTITWSSSSATVTGDVNATVTNVQNTYYENNSMRLGTSNGGGQIRIDTDANIVSIVVTAKAYSGTRTGTLTVGDQSVEVTNTDYVEFDLLTLDTPTNSMVVSTPSSSVRINIQSIVINCSGSQEIGKTEDCLGLETFIDTYLHMDDYEGTEGQAGPGWCKDEEHNYYGKNTNTGAKYAFNSLNANQRRIFTTNSAYLAEWTRLKAWAAANGETLGTDGENENVLKAESYLIPFKLLDKNSSISVIAIISLVSITAIGGYFFIRKRKEQ